MQRSCVLVLAAVLLLACSAAAAAEPTPALRKVEFSSALSFQSVAVDGAGRSTEFWNIPLRVGVFLTRWLEVEPELMLTKVDYSSYVDEPWSYLASLNVAANFLRPKRAVPFVLAGAGFGNGFPLMGTISGSSDYDVFAMNLGGGLKYFVIPAAALRLEYRFSHFRVSYTEFGEQLKTSMSLHQILIGVSLMF